MKSLYTCGDSFMSVDYPDGEVTSFLELYAQQKGFRHVSLGRPGATNYVIRLQIDRAIRDRADYVIVSATSSDRFDIPTEPEPWNPDLRLEDVHYQGYRAMSQHHVQSTSKIVSDVEYNILHERHQNIVTEIQRSSLKHYLADLHGPSLQRHKEMFMIRDGLHELSRAGIAFVFIPAAMWMYDWSQFEIVWPADKVNPYSMLMEQQPYDYEKTVTHNDQSCHDRFLKTLTTITRVWT